MVCGFAGERADLMWLFQPQIHSDGIYHPGLEARKRGSVAEGSSGGYRNRIQVAVRGFQTGAGMGRKGRGQEEEGEWECGERGRRVWQLRIWFRVDETSDIRVGVR